MGRSRRPYGSVRAEKEERRKRQELKRMEREEKRKEREKRQEILERFDAKMAELKKSGNAAEVSPVNGNCLPKCWKCPECGTLNAPREMICVYCGLGKISEKEEGDGKKINA